jgi:SM-20-related protein
MPDSSFFAGLGLFVARDFLDSHLCERYRSEVCSGARGPVSVVDGESYGEKIKETVRRTTEAKISSSSRSEIEARLTTIKPLLESHFNLRLTGCEKPQFLIYNEGDFFLPHQDRDDEPEKPDYVRKRKVSIVIFLNSEAAEPQLESYCGGSLAFYGLIDDPRWQRYGFPLVGEAGLMIAFRSEVLHEVTAVTFGERYTIVSWFF